MISTDTTSWRQTGLVIVDKELIVVEKTLALALLPNRSDENNSTKMMRLKREQHNE